MAKSSQVTDTFNEDVDGFLVDKPVDEYLDDLMYGAYSGAESTITSGLATGRSCEPLFEECVTQSECREKILQTLNKVFGFTSFRPGQLDTIERLLRGKSTLVMLSTGAGKSLCYQLAAYMYAQRDPCVAMVISPLVSLMEDQVVDLPKGVKGVCLHTNQTETARAKFMSAVVDGKVHFMLCSPEFLCSTSSSNIEFFNKIPPISFACIDEAHCLSQWSHNFRPSYLRVCKILRVRFGVQCFLGLTATASQETITQITSFLNLDNLREGCIKGNLLPPNLNLSVSKDNNKEQALLDLLQSERFRNCQSIIIYCTRRERTDSLASLIRSTLPGETTAKVPVAESYHAGLTAAKRRGVQKLFMNGKLRIVVATVAFGMGLDKSDVRAVIHYNIPKGFESYIQEIGRAGRDGLPAECHVFLEPEGTDIAELEKHTYADSVDQSSVRKLLSMLYQPCKCQMLADSMKQVSQCDTIEGNVAGSVCPGHERPIVLQSAISQLNATEQVIATLLFYLELQNPHWLENLSSVYSSCTIKCYGSSEELHTAAKKCIPLGVALALSKKRSDERIGRELTFDILEVSNLLNKPSGFIKKELRQLQWIQTTDGKFKRTGLIVEFGNLAMRVRAPGNLDEEELDYIHAFLKNRVISQENKELKRLHYFYHTLSKIAYKDYFMVSEEAHSGRSDSLKSCIVHYFEDEEPTKDYVVPERVTDSAAQTYISSQVTSFISTYGHENEFSGRDVAKILYGIASPNYPPNIWGRVRRFWRSLLGYDFNLIVKIATERLILTSRF
ncbi:ATP-dependent DNA helicase Q4-like [Watersipora subatra]|uniref:ATP-dependent DNA helicase Q4-like n=1 Tax=Watersipora subatra TaxID=2589382 RepID=UPI00355B837F